MKMQATLRTETRTNNGCHAEECGEDGAGEGTDRPGPPAVLLGERSDSLTVEIGGAVLSDDVLRRDT